MLASRLPLATAPGFLLALATFWLLWMTINMPLEVYDGGVIVDTFTRKIVEREPAPIRDERRRKPDLEFPEVAGPPTTVANPPAPTARGKPSPAGRVEIRLPPGPGPGTAGTDTDATPWVRIEPTYPPSALARGTEGSVLVQFSITASGAVTDLRIIESDPPRVFDKAALDAVRQWRYRPKVVDGQPVERVGLQTRIRFELPDR